MPALSVRPNPIRAEELVIPLATFQQGNFTVFLPSGLAPLAALGTLTRPKVHVFFAAGGVQGDISNDVLVHGLRSSSNNTDWILIAVRGIPNSAAIVTDADIRTCLSSVGVNDVPAVLRLTGHSRGCDSLVASLQPTKITTLAIVERVVFLDEAVEHAPKTATSPGGEVTVNRVRSVKQRGIPADRIVSYEVNNRSVNTTTGASARVPGAKYFELPPDGMAAIGCVRLIGDGLVRNPGLSFVVAGNPQLQSQIVSMLLPGRGNFSVMVAGGQDLKQFCRDHAAAIAQIKTNVTSPGASVLNFVNTNDLTRYGGYIFSWGIAAHHFFVAEIAHELTK